ncbi:hypothetical protein GOODEAATRI_021014 [Goodea atripinnis]|uniref:Uncharacterized protein n=1 Tax=Goodea atripinnis TaxID=208336 RepID=A0ABV0P6L0_9TELE
MGQHANEFSQLNESSPPGFVYNSESHSTSNKNRPIATIIATIYRPPILSKDFINDMFAFLTHICSLAPNIVLLGYLNIHMDNYQSYPYKGFYILFGQLWVSTAC